MPKMTPDNQNQKPSNKTIFWPRGGRLNQKRHVDMTEEEKANIAGCPGEKAGHPCKNPVFRCPECGNYGCAQEVPDKCTAQGFKNDKCLHCGTVGSRIPVMENEYAKYIAEWKKNDL
jgi:hypothetical protein